ncbi:MAG: hypothetical protein JW969_09130 [Spirochaetales bacterium]|nr:hypothetical protein [Spirochaetales bacterium]
MYNPVKVYALIPLVLFLIITACCCAEETAYRGAVWQKGKEIKFAGLPVLEPGEETFNYYQGVLWTKGENVHWVVDNGKKQYALLRWNAITGKTERVCKSDSRIRGAAYVPEENTLILRKTSVIEFYDNNTLEPVRSMPFERIDYWWQDITVQDGRLYAVSGEDGIAVFNLATGEKLKTLKYGKEKVQRLFPAGNKKLWLWSSYWGARLYLYNTETGKIELETFSNLGHRLFFMASAADDGSLGIYDPDGKVFTRLIHKGRMWIDTGREHEILGDGLAYRDGPLNEKVTASFTILPAGDEGPAEAVFAIPLNSFAQSLDHEKFPGGGEYFTDDLGNRYVRFSINELKKGRKINSVFYQADVKRWQVWFDLDRIVSGDRINVPDNLKQYLQNEKAFALDDPSVKALYASRFAKLLPLSARIEAIYNFARDEIKDVWDEKNDYMPVIIKHMHGGCTEHSYFQIAMLRLAGLPARFNWNYFPQEEGDEMEFNHKFAEVWLPASGWVPLEPLGRRLMPGQTSNHHFFFAVRKAPGNEWFKGWDRIGYYTGKNASKLWESAPIGVTWKLTVAADGR